jgi:lipoprotein-anchoring transpeptidase ErfK/SrfK
MLTNKNSKLTKKAIWIAAVVLIATSAMAQSVRVPRQIVVSIPDRKLVLVEDGRILKTYSVAVGAPVSPSPEGQFAIVNRIVKPTYYHSGTVIEAGPENPLGTRWIGLSQKGYGIHGTNVPKSIGKAASHGCIRMAQADLEEIFEMVRPGDTVEIRSELDDQIAQMFGHKQTTLVADTQTTAAAAVGGGQ